MDEKWKHTLDSFERVWPRVDPSAPPPPPPDRRPPPPGDRPPPPKPEETRPLAELLRRQAEAERLYLALAKKAGRGAARTLHSLAMQSRALTKRLQTEYLLRTGDTLPLPRGPARVPSVREGLRRAWEAAGEDARAFRAAAARTKDPGLRALYYDAAETALRQSNTLRELARRSL